MGRHESVCPTCGRSFVAIGRHWSQGDCDYPPLDAEQRELIAGLLLGDGFIRKPGNRDRDQSFPAFELEMINHEYVEWVAERLEPFTSNLTTRTTGRADSEVRRMYTVGHPGLQRAAFWSQMDRPKELAYGHPVNARILNIVYATRGSLVWVDGGCGVRIRPDSRGGHLVKRLFREQGWTFGVYRDRGIHLHREYTEPFIEFIGEAAPGFAWKWRYDDEAAYREGAPTVERPA